MLLPLRFPKLWLTVGWILVAAAVYVCLTPNAPGIGGMSDKSLHFAGYFGLTVWFTGIYPRARYIAIAVSLLLMGIAIEVLQSAMHAGRNGDPRDVMANAIGIAVGITLALAFLGGWMQRIESWIVPRE